MASSLNFAVNWQHNNEGGSSNPDKKAVCLIQPEKVGYYIHIPLQYNTENTIVLLFLSLALETAMQQSIEVKKYIL